MSRFYLPTPEPPPRPPTPPADDDEEEQAPERPPLPSGPSRPPPPAANVVDKRPVRPAPHLPPAPKAASTTAAAAAPWQTRSLSVRKVSTPSSSSCASRTTSNGSASSTSLASSTRGAVTSPSGISSNSVTSFGSDRSTQSAAAAYKSARSPSSGDVVTDGDLNGKNRLSRSQTWAGKRPQLKTRPVTKPTGPQDKPTIMTAAASTSATLVNARPARPTPLGVPPPEKPSRLSRSVSEAHETTREKTSLRRTASDVDDAARPGGPRATATSSLPPSLTAVSPSSSKSSISSIPEGDAPPRPVPARPPPARPAPPRPAPTRPTPPLENKTSSDTVAKPVITSRPPAHIPTRKVPKKPEPPNASREQNNSAPVSQRMQARGTSVREVIKRVSPQTRRRAQSGRAPLDETNAAPAEDSDNASPTMKKRVWSSIRRVKKRSDSGAKPPASTGPKDGPDELGVLNRLVVQCVSYLNTPRGLNEEGLFRVPGDMTDIGKLRMKFINGDEVDLSGIMDPNTVAGLLKFHFRELRFSIMPRGDPTKKLLAAMKENNTAEARDVMANIPQENLASLRILLELFVKVRDNSEVNLMTSANLGQTCGMAIFHDMGAANSAFVLRFLIDNKEEVLP